MLLKRKMFVIMDKKRTFIVQHGADKYKTKYLTHIDQTETRGLTLRIMFYDTLGRAQSGIKSSYNWLEDMLHFYPEIESNPKCPTDKNIRGTWIINELKKQLEIVEVEVNLLELKK